MKKQTTNPICDCLGRLLADTFILYVKTLNFHWNMTGSHFFMYHKLLQEQYESMVEPIDELAERIRMLHGRPPSSMGEFIKLGCLKESSPLLDDLQMIKELVAGHEHLVKHYGEAIALSQKVGDEGTADLLIERMRDHDKQAWLLRSHYTNG